MVVNAGIRKVLDGLPPHSCDVSRGEALGELARLDGRRWAVLDFETASSAEPRVVEIGLVGMDGAVLMDELVDPQAAVGLRLGPRDRRAAPQALDPALRLGREAPVPGPVADARCPGGCCGRGRDHLRSKFDVRVPSELEGVERLAAVCVAFDGWPRDRALRDLRRVARRHEQVLGIEAKDVRLGHQKRAWGTCEKDGVIRVHWRLVQAPAAAMEYVVAHEVVHPLHRNHSPEF